MDEVTDFTDAIAKANTLHRLLLSTWEHRAASPAVISGDLTRSYAQHRERVTRLANALQARFGLTRASRYAVLALNSPEYLELDHAAYLGAGTVVPLNVRLAPDEIAFILADSQAEVVFTDPTFAPLIEAVRHRVPSLRAIVLVGKPTETTPAFDTAYEDLLATATHADMPEPAEDDVACLMYTGGTTGAPKGVVHTQRSLLATARIGWPVLALTPDDIYLTATPLFHAASSAGYLIAPAIGCTVAVMPAFAPDAFIATAKATGATTTVLVPTMVRMLLDAPSFDPGALATLRSLVYGGSPMPLGTLARLTAELPDVDVVQAYGMTEGLPATCLDASDHRAGGGRLSSAGRPLPGITVSIRDSDGCELPANEVGEVCIRGECYASSYWNRPAETASALRDGWYHSGDLGYLDDGGYLFLVDRVNDMIITGGENVYSSEVESALSTHPAVAEVAVFGIPSEEWGETVHATVVVREGHQVTPDDLIAHARSNIAAYKAPRSVDLRREPLPISGAGKTLKRLLREPHWSGSSRRVG